MKTFKILNYTIEFSSDAKWSFNHFEFKHDKRYSYRNLTWWKFYLNWGQTHFCEECESENGLNGSLCDSCYEHNYCECGQRLEDSYGSPGDGLCRKCD